MKNKTFLAAVSTNLYSKYINLTTSTSYRPEDLHRIRVEHMERQLANLTGLVQKALVNQNTQIAPIAVSALDPNYLVIPTQCHGL